MSYEDLVFLSPSLAVLIGVLLVNFLVPIKTRLDHALATALSSGVVWGAWGLVAPTRDALILRVAGIVIGAFIADFVSTFISFTNRIRNAIVTAIVFVAVQIGALFCLFFVFGARGGWH
jgi:hypothetical protein